VGGVRRKGGFGFHRRLHFALERNGELDLIIKLGSGLCAVQRQHIRRRAAVEISQHVSHVSTEDERNTPRPPPEQGRQRRTLRRTSALACRVSPVQTRRVHTAQPSSPTTHFHSSRCYALPSFFSCASCLATRELSMFLAGVQPRTFPFLRFL